MKDGALGIQIGNNFGANITTTTQESIQFTTDSSTNESSITVTKDSNYSKKYDNVTTYLEDHSLLTTDNPEKGGSKIVTNGDSRGELNKIFLEESHEMNMKRIRQFFREQKYFERNRLNGALNRSKMESQDDKQNSIEINRPQNDRIARISIMQNKKTIKKLSVMHSYCCINIYPDNFFREI
uniref:Uncharacterized protein n=1 Tax=Heterorhabditis bacteriophora TaxID=37862 RepID=A0A1I7WVX4_HETBA